LNAGYLQFMTGTPEPQQTLIGQRPHVARRTVLGLGAVGLCMTNGKTVRLRGYPHGDPPARESEETAMTTTLRVFRSVLALPFAAGRLLLTLILGEPGYFLLSPYGLA
jgi:hypothetical protein